MRVGTIMRMCQSICGDPLANRPFCVVHLVEPCSSNVEKLPHSVQSIGYADAQW